MASLITFLLLLSAAVVGFLTPPCAGDNVLYSGGQDGSTLAAGNSLTYGSYSLKMQEDCNLVLYDGKDHIWATNTANAATGCYLSLLSDGNLVIYDEDSKAVWSNGDKGSEGYYVLVLQRDRNLVVYGGARWATASNAP